MLKKKSRYTKLTASLMCTALLFGCSNKSSDTSTTKNSISQVNAESLSTIGNKRIADVISETVVYDKEDLYSDWKSEDSTSVQLSGKGADIDGSSGAIADGNIITIKTSGTYVISGKLNDGQIIVDAEDKATVRLVLNGAEINSSTNAPIYVKKAEKTVISLVEGTENLITDGEKYNLEGSDDEPNAAIFSKDNLTINGTGKLVVKGNYNNGITGKDELKITGGIIDINAADDGLMGRDLLAVKNGDITIKAGGDAVKSTNDKNASKGIIAIEGGTFNLIASNDGIQAETSLLIADGDFAISTGGGSPETIETKENGGPRPGETDTTTKTTSTETDSDSAKGLKAGAEVAIGGGKFNIDSLDDAVHSNNSVTINGGKLAIATGDDGIHGDSAVLTKGGDITIRKSYEGIESKVITIADGDIQVNASDDGINIGGGMDASNTDMQSTSSENSLLTINGGNVYVNAQGDGLDSNGSISMTGGTVIVSGPTNDGNGPLDYDQTFDMSGGFLIAAGSSGMAQATSEDSKQYSMLMTYPETLKAGTILHLEDSKGNTIATFAPEKDYQSVVLSSPKLKKDGKYALYSGGSATGNEANGYYVDGKYSGGTKVVEFTIAESVTWLNESGITTAKTGGPGGGGQTPPDGGNRGDMFSNLDDATKAKAQAILEKERAGTITREEAQAQLKELGIDFPAGKGPQQ